MVAGTFRPDVLFESDDGDEDDGDDDDDDNDGGDEVIDPCAVMDCSGEEGEEGLPGEEDDLNVLNELGRMFADRNAYIANTAVGGADLVVIDVEIVTQLQLDQQTGELGPVLPGIRPY